MASKIPSLATRVGILDTRVGMAPASARYGDDRRISRHLRGYGVEWEKLRLTILKRDGYRCRCAGCKTAQRARPAHQVDHIVSKANWMREYGSLEGCDDPSNLQAINRDCHVIKTNAERRSGG